MRTFDYISRYFWAICIAITFVNFGIDRRRSPTSLGNDVLRRRILVAMIVPWLVMGAGIIFGNVPGIWNYFRPQDFNPYVWAWYVSIWALSCAFAYWVMVRGGASKVAELRLFRVSFFGRDIRITERWVKVYAAIGPPFVVFWLWLVWNLNVPIPQS